jgi:aminoglycoside phosphotransferase (APT) family kinase protein
MVDIYHIDDAFKDYILNSLLPRLDVKAGGCSVNVPLTGKKSSIRLVKTGENKGYAVRAFPKSSIKEARHLIEVDSIFEKYEVPAPRIVDFAEYYSSKGVTFIAEEYLSGSIWENLKITEKHAKAFGHILAKLHSLKREYWGGIEAQKKPMGTFGSSQLKRVGHRLHRVKKFDPDTVKSEEFHAIKEWFRSLRPMLDSLQEFHLIHDKINSGNIIYSEADSQMYFLDFATLQYGYRAKDMIPSEQDLLGGKKDLIDIFQKEYFSHFPEKCKEEYKKLSLFFKAYYHLSRSAVNIRRDYESRTKKHKFKLNFYDNFLHHWKSLWSMIEGGN